MQLQELINYLETIAPPSLQESYDNSGLIVGSAHTEITGVLITLDCIESIVDEAIEKKCNVIVAHHPIVFGGLKKLNGKNYVERTVIKAIKNNIAIYAIHTNLDNVLSNGVNQKIAQKIGLQNLQILAPKNGILKKLVTFVPNSHLTNVQNAVFNAGAGHIGNYSECSFNTEGNGTFTGNKDANPFVGQVGLRHTEPETRFETVFPAWVQTNIINALLKAHPYEEVAYDVYALENNHQQIGAGIIGVLPEPILTSEFYAMLKSNMDLKLIRFTKTKKENIQTIAVCGGSGSFLLKNALSQQVDAFVTADFKYHEFFDAEEKLTICDIGHYESEKFTKELLSELIVRKFTNFAVLLSNINTNPVNYYI